jgi:hypothetical protein
MTSQSTTPAGTATAVSAAEETTLFDVREFARTARGNLRAELDLEAIGRAGIGPDAAHLARLLRDLERSTMQRMRNLLVTATHKDARVTAFLTTWAYEKFWIADALDAVLEASGHDLAGETEGVRRRVGRERADRRGPVRRAIAGNIAGVQLVAAHVASGLVDEWVTTAAYRRLGDVASALGSLVDTVVEIKARHIRFLAEDAQRRLSVSSRARRLARAAVVKAAWPVGIVDRPATERSFFETIVFGDAEGRAEAGRIAALVASLPGLAPVSPSFAARLAP